MKCFLSKFFCLGIAPGGLVTSNTICKFCRACSLQRAQSQRNVKKLFVLSKFRFIPLLRDFLSFVSFFQTEIGTPALYRTFPTQPESSMMPFPAIKYSTTEAISSAASIPRFLICSLLRCGTSRDSSSKSKRLCGSDH